MSTKTTFKRIALVAVSSLGLGLLSVIPATTAKAAVVGLTISTPTDGTASRSKSDSASASTFQVEYLSQNVMDTVTVKVELVSDPGSPSSANVLLMARDTLGATGDTNYNKSVTYTSFGTSKYAYATTDTVTTNTNMVMFRSDSQTYSTQNSDSSISTRIGQRFAVYLESSTGTRVAGTYSFKVTATPYNTGVAGTAVTATGKVTVAADTSQSKTASAANSTAVMYQGSAFVANNTVDSAVSVLATASNTARAIVRVTLANADGVANAAMESVTATITAGTIGDGTTQGRSVVLAYPSTYLDLQIKSDGTAGSATVNISTPSVTFAAKTVIFYSASVSTINVVQNANTITTSSNPGAITVVAKDANGNINGSNTAIYIFSDALGVVSDTSTACTFVASSAVHTCTVTGLANGTANVTVGTVDKGIVATQGALKFTVNNTSPVSAKLAFNKATYAPGEKGYIILSVVDAAGKNVAGTVTSALTSAGITSSMALSSVSGSGIAVDSLTSVTSPTLAFKTVSSNGYESKEPVFIYPFYAPAQSGTITLSATGGAGLPSAGQVAITASAKVTNEASDAANAALAAVTALASQVSAFITKVNAQITTLTDLVMKIQKKVKA